MYVVRDIKTQEVVHINPAPLSQKLKGKDVYYNYDGETMEIGKTGLTTLPEYFTIDAQGYIKEWSLEKKIKQGVIQIGQEQKIDGDQIVEKTISEMIKEGLIILEPTQKVVTSGGEESIVNKTPSELVTEGLIDLSPYQKIVGKGIAERIVDKSPGELVKDGLLELTPNQRLEEEKVITYSDEEMFNKGYIDLAEYKRRKIEELSELLFELREEIIPEYKLVNSAMGIYGVEEANKIKAIVQAFRDEYYNLKSEIEKAGDVQEIQDITENFLKKIRNKENLNMEYKNGE